MGCLFAVPEKLQLAALAPKDFTYFMCVPFAEAAS